MIYRDDQNRPDFSNQFCLTDAKNIFSNFCPKNPKKNGKMFKVFLLHEKKILTMVGVNRAIDIEVDKKMSGTTMSYMTIEELDSDAQVPDARMFNEVSKKSTTELFRIFSFLSAFLLIGLSTAHACTDRLLDWSSAAKWARLQITNLVVALSN